MKDTPITNEYIERIEKAMKVINTYNANNVDPYLAEYPENITNVLRTLNVKLSTIEIQAVKKEFIETLENYNKISFQIKHYELKFKLLDSWICDENQLENQNARIFNASIENFLKSISKNVETELNSTFIDIRDYYITVCIRISNLKYAIRQMLDEFQAIGQLYLESSNLHLAPSKTEEGLQKRMVNTLTEVKIASKRKTDVIKILSAMYDSKMFVDTEKKTLTNKQKMMEAFGEFLGEDFSNYSSYLSQSKDKNPDVFIRTFDNLRATAKEYFNQ